ncbi:hypothetical protein Ppa06_05170 [Planomonospora parontospora subsp. parontospora]|uniref:Uncharacterized protein n=2 Tax=Planomonospora parontospora TaxID=58119 RepID=A0AA37F2D6_9ACTN|nr:hypothetical protein GCM10010126_05180 [Planomonospora parontospora]GII06719.1 hypothetical protein Ppa06_05170 [Planomonospora parontospora subsp. parontospora]
MTRISPGLTGRGGSSYVGVAAARRAESVRGSGRPEQAAAGRKRSAAAATATAVRGMKITLDRGTRE